MPQLAMDWVAIVHFSTATVKEHGFSPILPSFL